MWDASREILTNLNYVAFKLISSRRNVNNWGCIASQDMNSTIALLCCECVMQGIK
jgi:hypothetical protein